MDAICGGDVVICSALDRMFRSSLDALQTIDAMKDRGVEVHLLDIGGNVTGDGVTRLVFTILSATAEWERDRTSDRIRETKKHQATRGRYLGGSIPFGCDVDENGFLV